MKLKRKLVIAIDGFSSCGKSTFAKKIASELNYVFIDTGAMYRTVSLYVIEQGLLKNNEINEEGLQSKLKDIAISFELGNHHSQTLLNGENVELKIRGVEVSNLVSEVSKLKFVRQHLVKLQQQMGENKGIVMDGRDIGTVVFPNADLKIYMTASSEVRAKRRFDELKAKGLSVNFDEIKENIEHRDKNDLSRSESPLKKADDAFVLDNSSMTIDQQMAWFEDILRKKNFVLA